jgi:hypothetical protein
MKRAVLIIAICLLHSLVVAEVVDDFDNYATGPVSTVVTDGSWVTDTTDADAVIEVDPADTANQVMSTVEAGGTGGVGQTGSYAVLNTDTQIPDGTTKTLFLRFRINTLTTDQAIGLTSIDAPTTHGAGDWNEFHACFRFTAGNIDIRDGGSWNTNLANRALNIDTWYNLWFVVINAAGATASDTVQMYMNTTGDGATEADRLKDATSGTDTFVFRVQDADTLDRLYWRAQDGSVATDKVYIDDVYITNGVSLSKPSKITAAHEPTPANGAPNVALDSTLSWYTGVDPNNPANPNPAITSHYVYMQEDEPNFIDVTPIQIASGYPTVSATAGCDPLTDLGITLAEDKTYYWRVDESVNYSGPSDANTIKGSTWSFDALKSIPVIVTQPKDAVAAPGESAQFGIKATVVGTLTYTWYYSDDATIGDDTVKGADANTLTINPVALADEGYYYCAVAKVGNEANLVNSNIVKLGVKQQVAHWTLDGLVSGQYEDSIGGHNADPNGVPSFVAGAGTGTANGVTIDQVNGFATADTWNPSEMTNQITVSLWAKWAGQTTPTTWQGLISKEVSYGADMMWQLEVVNAAEASSNVMLKNGLETGNLTINPLTVGTWEHIAVTFDGTTATIYRNGVNAASGAWSMGTKTDAPVNIGVSAASLTENLMFNGDLDDIQMWNYALTQNQVIDEYYAVTGLGACTNKPTYDFDDDCLVTLSDFAMMATEWLTNGLYQPEIVN